jgi:antitoxin YefM
MSLEVSYSEARSNLASILDQVTNDLEVVVIKRRGHEPVALISESELSSMLETEYLFRSPKNAKRLEKALQRAEAGTTKSSTIAELKKEFGVK